MKVRLVWAVCLLWCAVASASLPPLNAQLGLAYDKSGNLLFRTNGSLVQTFATDAGNQLTSITRTGPLTVSGATPGPASSVTVNGTNAQLYGDWTFAATNQILVNGQNPFTIIAQSATGARITNSSIDYLPTTVNLAYDANGCLTNDGTLAMFYDAENRLTNITASASWKTDFIYDGLGRRRVARDYGWASGNWQLTNETRYVYDGLLPIQERNSNNVATVTYTRGADFSGSFSGAGGIGGLLARTGSNGPAFYHVDGVGNATALLDSRQVLVARYEYGPFGNMLGKWWALADGNAIGFSSMPGARGIVFYREPPYFSGLQRWGSPDPIGEAGGINLYGFVGNNPISYVDPYGRAFHVVGESGLLTPGPLGFLSGDTALENLAAGGYNAIPEAGNILANAGNGLMTAMDLANQLWGDAVAQAARILGGNEQDAENAARAAAVGGFFLGGEAGKLGKAIKCEERALGRTGAFNKAKRDLGIPRSQQPTAVKRVPMTDRNGNWIMGPDGKPIMTREYSYPRSDGSTAVIQDHSAGHDFGGTGDQGPHFNVRPEENTRNGTVPGTQPHYPFKQ